MTTNNANVWNPQTILGINANSQRVEQRFTAEEGQTLFTLVGFTYALSTGSLAIYQRAAAEPSTDKGAGLLTKGVHWAEVTPSTFSLVAPAAAGDQIIAVGFIGITGAVDVRDTDIFVTNYQALRDYAGTETSVYAQGEVTVGDGGEHFFSKITGAAVGFYVDNGFDTIVPTGGDGSSAWLCDKTMTNVPRNLDPTGVVDATATMLDSNFTQSSEISLGDGTYRMNKWMELNSLKGNGYSTVIKPFSAVTNDGFAISLGAHSVPHGAFDFQWVRDLAMDGETGGCIRFDDQDDVDGADLSSVGWLLENLTLRSIGGGTCIKSEFGTIGNKFNNIATYGSDFGYWLQDNRFSVQHTGANTWNQNHMQRSEKAAVYISDNQGGRGHWSFNECIIENNHGFGIFCKSVKGTLTANIGPLMINSVWFEKNGLEATPLIPGHTVDIDSITYTPRDMRFESFGSIVVNATHFKSIDIVDSDIACYDCRHDGDQGLYSVTKDENSTINLTNPSGGNGFSSCDEWSHTAPASLVSYFANRQPMLRMAHRSVKAPASIRTSISQGFEKAIAGNYTFGSGMTGVQVVDGLIHDTCLELTVTANQTSGSAQINETLVSIGGLGGLTTPTVSGITQANPAVVSATAHGYVDNQLVSLTGVVGMTELNDREYYIDYIDANSFSLREVDSTGYTAWSSGGTFVGLSSWAVLTCAVKVMSGVENIDSIRFDNGGAGRIGNLRLGKLGEWVTTVSMINMSDTGIGFANTSMKVRTNSGGSAVFRVADLQAAAFRTKQEASDFIHSGIFEYTSGEELLTTPDTVTDTAACSLTTEQSNLVTTGAAVPTLADGFEGQVKTIYHKTYAGAATITPANMHGGTSVATSAAGQGVTFKFTDGKWLLIGNPYNLTIA